MPPKQKKPVVALGGAAGDLKLVAKYLDLGALKFDELNPRVAGRLGEHPTQADIEALLTSADYRALELVPSFLRNGFIPYDPLIVRADGAKFVVLEGNRRLAALRHLWKSADEEQRAGFKRHHLDRIPCLVFEGDNQQLLAYLGLRHISKTRDWSPNAKGAFVERLLRTGATLAEAAQMLNASPPNLKLIMLTRRLFERASDLGAELPDTSSTEGDTYFWHLGDAVRREKTRQYIELEENPNPLKKPKLDESKFENLVSWIFGNAREQRLRVIQSIRQIPELDRCLGNPRSTAALERGGSLEEALEELVAAGQSVVNHLDRARSSLKRALSQLTDVDKAGLVAISSGITKLEESLDQFKSGVAHRRAQLK